MLSTPLRIAQDGAENLAALAEARRSLPGLERALSTQLAALLARVAELSSHVEQVPTPRHALARGLPPIGLDVAAVRSDGEHVSGVADAITGDVAALDPKLVRLQASVDRLSQQLERLQSSLLSLSAPVKDAAAHLPDPDAPGILAKARDALTGTAS